MTLVTPHLKKAVEELYGNLRSTKEKPSLRTPKAVARLIGPQTSEAWEKGDFKVLSDEPKSMGGNETAPTPSTQFMASIASSENVVFARQAALRGLDFDSYETTVEGDWDMRGMFEVDGADAAISEIRIETRITTKATPSETAEILLLTHKRCPLTATVAKSTKITRKLFVNGKETRVAGF
jgi:uncharacterized OsmC-like protein